MTEIATIWIWLGFSLFIITALCLDTFVIGHKIARPQDSMRASLLWTLVWIACALLFNLWFWFYLYYTYDLKIANANALIFFTGYLIEKSLSIDNLFVFYLIFSQFRIPKRYQQRILSYGIWGAIIMRLILIVTGVWLVTKFHWLLYVMGAFLILTGIKIFCAQEKEKDLSDTLLMRIINLFVRSTSEFQDERFFIRKNKLLYATPLFVALLFIEFSDLIFALDSIPAIFAITKEPFIIWSSNIFAILGLRSLYFLLANMVEKFSLLKYGIAIILIFVGVKMVVEPWVEIPILMSLGVIVGVLTIFTFISIWFSKHNHSH